MLEIVPILCLILFIGLVEYRLKKHLDEADERINRLEKIIILTKETSYTASKSNQKKIRMEVLQIR